MKKEVNSFRKEEEKVGGKKLEAREEKLTRPVQKKKQKSLKKQLEEIKEELEKLKDQYLRKAAEFENYKKRAERDFLNLIQNANTNLIAELLPILDDLERALKFTENSDFDSLHKGVEMINQKLEKILENQGLKPIEAVGKEFDPELHEALMQVESDTHSPDIVVEEHLKGYMLNDRVIRHSKVIVSK